MALNLYTNRHHKTINLLAALQISEGKKSYYRALVYVSPIYRQVYSDFA